MAHIPETPYDIVYLGIGTVAWAVAGLKIRAWRRDPSRGLLVVALTTAAPATSFVVAAPVLYRLIDRIAHRGNLATLLVYLGITGFSAAAVVLARIWTPPGERAGVVAGGDAGAVPGEDAGARKWDGAGARKWDGAGARKWDGFGADTWRRLRRRLAVFAVLVPVMTVLFFTGGADSPETPLTFDTTFATVPQIAVFLLIYQALFGFALTDISRVCFDHAAQLPPGWLRRGIRLIALGGLLACGYVGCKIVAIGAGFARVRGAEWLSTALGPAFAALGAVLITTGFAGPAVAAWARRRRAYQALRPLWDLVYQADGRLALEAPASAWTERLAFRDLEWRTARRGLEIRDGQLTLRPWVDPVVVTAAAEVAGRDGLEEADRDALIVAAALRFAVQALNSGAPPRLREDQVPLPGLAAEPAGERAHLVRVARSLYTPLTGEALAVATATTG